MSSFSTKSLLMTLVAALILTILTPVTPLASSSKDQIDAVVAVVEQEENEVVDKATTGERGSKDDAEDPEGETPAEKEEEKAKKPKDPRVQLLNGVQLSPKGAKSEDLEVLVDQIMNRIITPDMGTYEQVKVCYDYIVNNTSYGSHLAGLGAQVGGVTANDIYRNYGAVEGYGAVALVTQQGMCNAYSSAFILMAQDIGLDAYLVKGSTQSAGGGYAYHEWAEVKIDGQVYVFDPQLEQNLTRDGLGVDNVFAKTYEAMPGRYVKI